MRWKKRNDDDVMKNLEVVEKKSLNGKILKVNKIVKTKGMMVM